MYNIENKSTVVSLQSTISHVGNKERSDVFQDLPLLDRTVRLTVMELKHCDKQIVNELVYRWCRILTRVSKKSLDRMSEMEASSVQDIRKVLIIDLIGSLNPVRLATVMKRDEKRMRLIGVVSGSKINSTFITLNSYINGALNHTSLKLVVIYQDEFFIMKTLTLLKETIKTIRCQILLVVPRLSRQEQDVLNLTSNYQKYRCGFCVKRGDIRPAPAEFDSDSYSTYLNQVYFSRYPSNKNLPDRIEADLKDEMLSLSTKVVTKNKDKEEMVENPLPKRIKC